MNQIQRNQLVPGLILIVLGVLFLLRDQINLSGGIVLLALGAIFLIGYFTSCGYGLLIPGCILAGLGLGEMLNSSSLGLGLGFIAIFGIDTLVRGRMSHWWPLIPGVIITADAALSNDNPAFAAIRNVVADWWPLLLVLLGVLILLQSMSRRQA